MTVNVTVHPVERVLSAMDALIDQNPDLERAVDFYEELLPVMYAARPSLDGLALSMETARQKLKEGVPLLWGDFGSAEAVGTEPNVDLFMTLCRLAAEGENDGGEALMRAFVDGALDLKALLERALTLDRAALAEQARAWGVDLALLEAISRYVLTPIAWAYAAAFGQALDFAAWQRGYCPVCGAWPTLSELRGRDKARFLRCGRCGTGWKSKRLQCLWCGNANQRELSFLFDPDHPEWRVDVCDYCRAYVKTIITFDPLEAEMLLVHDLETMGLDQMAVAEGYNRPHRQPQR